MVEDRQYQDEIIAGVREAIKQGYKRILINCPTGGGKTTIVSVMAQGIAKKFMPMLFLAHREELIGQLHDRLALFGISSGIIQGSKKHNKALTNVASIQTIVNRELPAAKFMFVDEAHHVAAGGYAWLLGQPEYEDTIIIGMTATPCRLDGRPLGDFFEVMVESVTVLELIEKGFLVQPRYFGVPLIEGQGKQGGDFNASKTFELANNKALYMGVVENWEKWAKGRKTIVFNINVEHSKQQCQNFIDLGYSAAHLDANTPEAERKRLLGAFRDGYIMILCNVGILTEGYDLPSISCVVLNRATLSVSLYMQMGGRGLRTAPGKEDCLIIDHGDNVHRHGFLESARTWSLSGKQKGEGVAPVKYCGNEDCGALLPASCMKCPDCGYEFEVKETAPKEGVLVELIPTHLQKLIKEMNVEEMAELAKIKKYLPGWAVRQLKELATFDAPGNFEEVFLNYLSRYEKARGYKRGWAELQFSTEFYKD